MRKKFDACRAFGSNILQQQNVGISSPKHNHPDIIMSPDFEGVYTPFNVDEPVWKGARSNRKCLYFWERDEDTPINSYVDFNDGVFPVTHTRIEGSFMFRFFGFTGTTANIVRLQIDHNTSPWHSILVYMHPSDFTMRMLITEEGSSTTLKIASPQELEPYVDYKIGFYVDGEGTFGILINDINVAYGNYNGTMQNGSQWTIGVPTDQQAFHGYLWDFEMNGIKVPLDEGIGNIIHDSERNIVGLLNASGEFEKAWSGRVRDLLKRERQVGNFVQDGKIVYSDQTFPTDQDFVISGKFNKIFDDEMNYLAGHSTEGASYKGWLIHIDVDLDFIFQFYNGVDGSSSVRVPFTHDELRGENSFKVECFAKGNNIYDVFLTVNGKQNSKLDIYMEPAPDSYPAVGHLAGSSGAGDFKGTIFDFSYRGVKIPIDEGEGTAIHDIEGNEVAVLQVADEELFWSKNIPQKYDTVMKITDYTEKVDIGPLPLVSSPSFEFYIDFKLDSLDPGPDNYTRFDVLRLYSLISTSNYVSAIHFYLDGDIQFVVRYEDGSANNLIHPILSEVGKRYKIHVWFEGDIINFMVNGVNHQVTVKSNTLLYPIEYCIIGCDNPSPDSRASALGEYHNFEYQRVMYPLKEGKGTAIHDESGNVAGTVYSTTLSTFWSGKTAYIPQITRPVVSFKHILADTDPYTHVSFVDAYDPAVTYFDIEISFVCTMFTNFEQQIVRLALNEEPWQVLGVHISTNNKISIHLPMQDGSIVYTTSDEIELGKAYHVKFLAQDGNTTLTVNGVEYTNTYTGDLRQDGTGQVFICNPADNQNFVGSVWDFRLFDLRVPLDEGYGNNIHDIHGNIVGVLNAYLGREIYVWGSSITINNELVSYNDDYDGYLIDPVPVIVNQPELMNINPHSNKLDNWPSSSPTLEILMNQVGLTGEPNTACYIADIAEDAQLYASYNLVDVSPLAPVVLKVYVKKQDTATYSALIYLRKMGDTEENSFVSLNPVSGNCFITADDSGNTEMQVESYGDFWIIYIYDIPVNTLNDTYRFTIYPVYYDLDTNQPVGNIATGSVVIGNVELYKNKTIADVSGLGPIFTNGSPVTVGKTTYDFHPHNISNDNMALALRVKSDGVGRILGTFLNRSTDKITLNDKGGVGTSIPYTPGQLNNVGVVVGTVDSYAGNFSSNNAYVHLYNIHYTEAVFDWTVMYIPEVLADETTSNYFTILRYGTDFYSIMLYVGYSSAYEDIFFLSVKSSADEITQVHTSGIIKVKKGQIYRILASSDGTTLSLTINGKKSTRALVDNTLLASDDIMIMGRSAGQSAGGILYDTNIEGQYIKINEGAGDIIHDSLGNPVGTVYTPNLDAFWIKNTYPNRMWLYVNGDEVSANYTGQLINECKKITQPDLAHGDMRGPLYPWRPYYDHTIINNNELGVLYIENGEDGSYGAAFNNDVLTEPGQRYKLQFRPIAQSEGNNNGSCYIGTGTNGVLYINAAMTPLGVYDEYQFVSIYETTRVHFRAGLSTIGAWKKYTDIRLSLVPEMIGNQLIKNNSFFDDSDNWTPVNVDISFPETGRIRITNNVDGANGNLSQRGIPVIAGKTYRFTAYTRVSSKGNAVRSCYHIGDDTDTLKYFRNVKANDNIATNLIITPDMDNIKVSLLVGSDILDNYADFQCVSLVEIPYKDELITNNLFEDGETDWTLEDGWSIADYRAKCDGTQIDVSRLTQSVSLTAGAKYRIFVNVVFHEAGSLAVNVGGVMSPYRLADTSYTWDVIAGDTGEFALVANNVFIGQIDSVFMTEVDWEEEDEFETIVIGSNNSGVVEIGDMETVVNADFVTLQNFVRDKFA